MEPKILFLFSTMDTVQIQVSHYIVASLRITYALLVQNDSVDDWVEDNPDHPAISHWDMETMQMRGLDYESYDGPEGYVPAEESSLDYRTLLTNNAFYFQPSFGGEIGKIQSEDLVGIQSNLQIGIDAHFEMDVGLNEQVDTFNLEEVEEPEEVSDVLEQLEQLEYDDEEGMSHNES